MLKSRKKVKYYFYILKCGDGSLYSGITKDPANREHLHNLGLGSVYVRTHGGGRIVHSEKHASLSRALMRESEVKKWPRSKKVNLINRIS